MNENQNTQTLTEQAEQAQDTMQDVQLHAAHSPSVVSDTEQYAITQGNSSPVYCTVDDTTMDGKRKLYHYKNRPDHNISDFINKEIRIKDIYIDVNARVQKDGENAGVIRSCVNNAAVNAAAGQNAVELEDITMETLTGAEASNTVTDIGGIAGFSSGVIRSCENHGQIGYRHMGYNIGGIAGTQSGTVIDCENSGNVQGRKEVGGIVGQMEPSAVITYSKDTLQILQEQLGELSVLADKAAGNAQTNAGKVGGQIGLLLLGQGSAHKYAVAGG